MPLDIQRLGPALVMTPDLEEALAFYRDVLGLRLDWRTEDQLAFALGDRALHAFRCEGPAGPGEHGRTAGSVISFEVSDLTAAMAALSAEGVRFLHARPSRNDAAGLSYAAFEAPGGNVHELVQRD